MHNRPYQNEALGAIKSNFEQGVYRQLVVMAGGSGKTVIFAQLPEYLKEHLPGQQLVLAHREELIDQAIETLRLTNPNIRIDKEKAKHKADPSLADVIVASVGTLGRKGTKRILKYNWERFDKVITDEAHHSLADSYMNIYEAGGYLKPEDNRLLIGFTATPQRGDGEALARLYKKIVYVYSLRQAITEGWLVDLKGIRINTNTSLDHVKTVRGDFDENELADTVNNPARNQAIVKAYLEHGEDRQAIGFTVNVKHAQDLAEMFKNYGVKAEAIWGDDPERAEKAQKHKSKDIRAVLNCALWVEGYDDWKVSCILNSCPTKSPVKFQQSILRGTRLEKLEDGTTPNLLAWTGRPIKRDCLVIDTVDSTKRHNVLTLPTLMGLSSKLDLKGKSLLWSVQHLEKAQEDYSHLDFSNLTDIDALETYTTSIDLFQIHFSPEVEQNSEFTWHSSAAGGYILNLPDRDKIEIVQNLLDKWQVSATIKGKRYKGERDTMEAVFQAADKLVQDICPESLKIVKREATWYNDPPSAAQLGLLAKFFRNQKLPANLTKGQASALIGSKLAKRA
jgi:superfamily II DNA or RNA helicase